MTRIICVASGKGGVGKTTVVANLAAGLAEFSKSVLVVDANTTTPNLGMHLGLSFYPGSLQDVLNRSIRVKDAVYFHESGFRVIPSDISLKKSNVVNSHDLIEALYKFSNEVDFILIDCAAGLGKEATEAIKAADEVITVTNPEMPALVDAMKVIESANRFGTRPLGVVVNRVKGVGYEFPLEEIGDFLGNGVIGHVSENEDVCRAIANKRPVVSDMPKSIPARQFRKIAANLVGEEYDLKPGVFYRLFSWLR
jgi:cell division ATPase MinD